MSVIENIKKLKDKYQDKAPLGVCFLGQDRKYIFDAGTNKVMLCKEIEFEIINKMFHKQFNEISNLEEVYGTEQVNSALENVLKQMEKENILQVTQFKPITKESRYREKIEKGQQQLTLELTEKCNLRCRYCIYNDSFKKDRNFGTKTMTEETAIKAIDCFARHTIDQDEIAITFYGGEPLIEFELMKKCIEYSKAIFIPQGKKLTFSFTTNLTLVTPEIANYLAEQENMAIIGSLDGPQDIHDHYRIDINGNGSFSRAIRGLKYLVEAFGDKAGECIDINMVYAPPYSSKKLQHIQDFYDSLAWLPDEIEKRMSYAENGTLPDDAQKELEKQVQNGECENDTLMKRAKENLGNIDFSKEAIEKTLLRIYHLPILDQSSAKIDMNACCLPGNRRLYVTVDGDFKMCERVGHAPNIGDVNRGIDIGLIKKEYLDNYAEKSYEDCSKCWAARLCGVCYSHCYKSGEFCIEDKRTECENVKQNMWQTLGWYYDILNENPEKLKYLEDIEVV